MEFEFRIQDPSDPTTTYLFEAIIEAMDGAKEGSGIFAFASIAGVDSLLLAKAAKKFLKKSCFNLVVGIDAVTNRPTLERLQQLESTYPHLKVRVFWNNKSKLFHPKIALFEKSDGRHTLIVGSGNLTPGGLKGNTEAYSVIHTDAREFTHLSAWQRFLTRHAENIRPIDEEALVRASKNVIRRSAKSDDVGLDLTVFDELSEIDQPAGRFLIAQVPKAGEEKSKGGKTNPRWSQAHFNKELVEQFFGARLNSNHFVYLSAQIGTGILLRQEIRPIVYSDVNKNVKIELGLGKGKKYPTEGRPVAVLREVQARTFHYMLLLPGDVGHAQMLQLSIELPKVGGGLPRVLTDLETVIAAWPECPLL